MERLYIPIIILSIVIFGCSKVNVSENPYFKEVYTDPSFIDYYKDSGTLVFTIKNPSQLDFNGKIVLEYDQSCLSITKEKVFEVKAESEKSGTIDIRKTRDIADSCYKDQNIILNLANNEGKIIYSTQSTIIKLISNK